MLSVIIRNLNESQYIGFALQSIYDHIPGAEVIIVDLSLIHISEPTRPY